MEVDSPVTTHFYGWRGCLLCIFVCIYFVVSDAVQETAREPSVSSSSFLGLSQPGTIYVHYPRYTGVTATRRGSLLVYPAAAGFASHPRTVTHTVRKPKGYGAHNPFPLHQFSKKAVPPRPTSQLSGPAVPRFPHLAPQSLDPSLLRGPSIPFRDLTMERKTALPAQERNAPPPHQHLLSIAQPFGESSDAHKRLSASCSPSEQVIIFRYAHAILKEATYAVEGKGRYTSRGSFEDSLPGADLFLNLKL